MDHPDDEQCDSHLLMTSMVAPLQQRDVIIAIDVGSSSIRCTAYDCSSTDSSESLTLKKQLQPPETYTMIASYSYPRKSIESNTGHVLIVDSSAGCSIPSTPSTSDKVNIDTVTTNDLFECIDICVDQVLHQLQQTKNDSNPCTYNVIGVGFTTFVMNLIGIDHNGRPIGNEVTMSYACQTKQVQEEVQQLQSELNAQVMDALYEATGVPLHTAYALAQLRVWYRTNVGGLCGTSNGNTKVHQWSTIASICLHRWCNSSCENVTASIPISVSEASWTGLLNYHNGQYETKIIDLLPSDCISALPNIEDHITNTLSLLKKDVRNTNSFLTLNGTYLRRWPLLQNANFFLGVGDGACANIGSKCTSLNRIACTIGTSAAARVCMYYPIQISRTTDPVQQMDDDHPKDCTEVVASMSVDGSVKKLKIPRGLFCYRIDQYHVLIGGALTDGGNIMEWINNHLLVQRNKETTSMTDAATLSEFESAMQNAEQLLMSDYNEYNSHSETTPSLMVVPFFSGERNTGYRSNATGVMVGLTLQTRSHHIVKACLEGITLRLHAIIQLICATVTPLLQQQLKIKHSHRNISNNDSDELSMMILSSGKALEKNQLWRTMIADCTGLPVYMEEQTYEGTSRGVAILMHHALFQPSEEVGPSNGSFQVEDIHTEREIPFSDTTKSVVMVQMPNPTVNGYWMALFERQEALIGALSSTSHWS